MLTLVLFILFVTQFAATFVWLYFFCPFKAAIWLAIVNCLAILILGIIEISVDCHPIGALRCDKWFLDNKSSVLVVMTALQVSNVWNGVCEENFYELIGSFIASLITSIDTGVMMWAKWPIKGDIQVTFLLVVTLAYQVIVFALAMPLYKIFTRRMHRKIGSDPRTQDMYKHHLLTLTLLKFDTCFSLVAIICAGEGIFNVENGTVGIWRFVGAIICAIIAICWAVLGWFSFNNEKRAQSIVFFVGFIMAPIYCIVWFVYSPYKANTAGKRALVVSFVVYAAITLVLHIALFIICIVRYKQFGMGLRDTLRAEKLRRRNEGRADEGFAELDSDEEFDLDISFDTNSGVDYQRMQET